MPWWPYRRAYGGHNVSWQSDWKLLPRARRTGAVHGTCAVRDSSRFLAQGIPYFKFLWTHFRCFYFKTLTPGVEIGATSRFGRDVAIVHRNEPMSTRNAESCQGTPTYTGN